jgi:hypothetical protein
MQFHEHKYPNFKIKWWFLVRYKQAFLSKEKKSHITKSEVKNIILDAESNSLVFDWTDLAYVYKKFLKLYSFVKLSDLHGNKKPLIPKFHQEYTASVLDLF